MRVHVRLQTSELRLFFVFRLRVCSLAVAPRVARRHSPHVLRRVGHLDHGGHARLLDRVVPAEPALRRGVQRGVLLLAFRRYTK